MSRLDAAAPDRLPWLPDEPKSKPAKRSGGALIAWAAAALVAVAGGSFWVGTRSLLNQPALPARHAQPTATVQLPAPRPVEPQVRIQAQPELRPAIVPQVRPAPVKEVRIAPPPAPKTEQRAEERASAAAE